MKANRLGSHCAAGERTALEPGRHSLGKPPRAAEHLEQENKPWSVDDLSYTIRLLAIIENDEHICPQNPPRVIEACQNHGHLLFEHEVEMLREWLVQLDQTKAREH